MKKGKAGIVLGVILIFVQILSVVGNSKSGVVIKLSFSNVKVFLYDLLFLFGYLFVGIIGLILLISGLYLYYRKPKDNVKKTPTVNKLISHTKSTSSNIITTSIFSIILLIAAIVSVCCALYFQDVRRDTYENIKPTYVYWAIIAINIYCVFLCIMSCVIKNKKFNLVTIIFLGLQFIVLGVVTKGFEENIFSQSMVLGWRSDEYFNNNQVYLCNLIWVLANALCIVINVLLFVLDRFGIVIEIGIHPIRKMKSSWYSSVKYREKCYEKVAKVHRYYEMGIISQEEYEKTKHDIMKNIRTE